MRRALLALTAALGCSSACGPSSEPREATEVPASYEATGTIVSIEGDRVLIDHEDIPGFMGAMTMSFPVEDPSVLENLEPGATVRFRIVVEDASYRLVRIEPVSP